MKSSKLAWTLTYYLEKIINSRIIDSRQVYALWEQQQLRKLFNYLEVDCVFDIGANEGQYAEMLRRKVGYQGLIISFEPIPRAAEIIRQKSIRDPKWVLVQGAVSDMDGEQQFNIMNDSQFSSLSKPRHDEVGIFANMNKIQQSITVQTELLETAWRRLKAEHGFSRPFLKMDTQGFDYKIVQAGQSVIRNFVGLQSELAIRKLYADSIDFRDSIALYEQSGFSMTAFVQNNEGVFPRLLESDCIMIRSDLVR